MKSFVKRLLSMLGYRVQGTRYIPRQLLDPKHLRGMEFADAIARRMMEVGTDLKFVQIGAFDGITADPLFPYIGKYGWSGVLLEPQPRLAEKLRTLYVDNDRIDILQAALDGERRQRVLFTVESDDAPQWAGGMASFDRLSIVKHSHLIPGLQDMVKEVTVDCIRFEDVLERLKASRLDLLQIDAEGADAYILSLFPFDRLKPAIIHWEIKNLTKRQREDTFDRLANHGYRFASSGDEDMLAILD